MQAIITKYLNPTNTRGSRYKASCEAMSVTVSADDALSLECNHVAACEALCKKMDADNVKKYGSKSGQWMKPKVHGQILTGEYVHVFTE